MEEQVWYMHSFVDHQSMFSSGQT